MRLSKEEKSLVLDCCYKPASADPIDLFLAKSNATNWANFVQSEFPNDTIVVMEVLEEND